VVFILNLDIFWLALSFLFLSVHLSFLQDSLLAVYFIVYIHFSTSTNILVKQKDTPVEGEYIHLSCHISKALVLSLFYPELILSKLFQGIIPEAALVTYHNPVCPPVFASFCICLTRFCQLLCL
jgi:hypothetical protein